MIREAQPHGCGFQRIEDLGHDAGNDLRAHAKADKSGVDGDEAAGFAHRGNNRRDVERTQNAHVDNFGRAADLVQNIRRTHRLENTVRGRDDGDVFAFANYAWADERILVVALECSGPWPQPRPITMRMTRGTLCWPLLMYELFAALFTICSNASSANSTR